jgi:hypothetical protein
MTVIIDGTTGISGVDGSASAPTLVGSDTNTGIYFPAADRIGFAEGGVQVGEFDSSGNFLFNSGYGSVATAYGCRAWVNFNGTGTVAIRASGNVSSVTDNGTGTYDVNFINAMPDIDYDVVATAMRNGTGTALICGARGNTTYSDTFTTTSVGIHVYGVAGSTGDPLACCVAVFR